MNASNPPHALLPLLLRPLQVSANNSWLLRSRTQAVHAGLRVGWRSPISTGAAGRQDALEYGRRVALDLFIAEP